MMDLTKITTPFGLLDDETCQRLRNSGGPYQAFMGDVWIDGDFAGFNPKLTYRVKPQPREFWVNVHPDFDPVVHRTEKEALQSRLGTSSRTIHVREVIEE